MENIFFTVLFLLGPLTGSLVVAFNAKKINARYRARRAARRTAAAV